MLEINNLSIKVHFRDRKDTKCWISTDAETKENELPHPLKLSKRVCYFDCTCYFVCTFLYCMAAFTKATKSGWGAATVLLYSG